VSGPGREIPAVADRRDRRGPRTQERDLGSREQGANMKKERRQRYRIAAAVLAASLVATACGDAAGPDGNEPSDGAATSDSGGDVSIDLWHIQTDHPQLVENAADRFRSDNEDVVVRTNGIENDAYKTQIAVALGANEPPCVFMSWGGGPLINYVDAGQVIDLTDYVEQDGYRDRFLDVSWGNVEVDGRVYGVPVEGVAAAFIWYNRVLFEELGLDTPDTWSELLEVIDALNANQAPWTGSMYYMYLVDRLGGPAAFEAAATRSGGSFEDEVFVRAGELLQDLVDRDAFNEGFNGLDWGSGQSRALMYADAAAMELMGNWTTAIILGENEAWYDENLDFFPFPEVEEGNGDPSNILGTVGENYYHVSSSCEHPDEAFELIQYLIDDEGVADREAVGRIPPVRDFQPEDPFIREIFDTIESADSVQLWYDQFLPPELADVHLEAVQALFGGSITPEEKASRLEQAAVEHFGE
jgi:raffinose/stachyose/melibiose transport system substrate-binding protein